MRSMQFMAVAALLALGTACSQDTTDANAANAGDAASPGSAQAQPGQARAERAPAGISRTTGASGEVIDGPLANDPKFQLPAPGAAGASPELVARSAMLDADTVQLALIEGMPESGAGIRVQVSPRGNVSLSGEVATIADRQRAHYLARALPGVAEVDFRELRVR